MFGRSSDVVIDAGHLDETSAEVYFCSAVAAVTTDQEQENTLTGFIPHPNVFFLTSTCFVCKLVCIDMHQYKLKTVSPSKDKEKEKEFKR